MRCGGFLLAWGQPWPTMLLAQGEDAVRIPLAQAKALVAALADGAADLAEVLATGGVYHA